MSNKKYLPGVYIFLLMIKYKKNQRRKILWKIDIELKKIIRNIQEIANNNSVVVAFSGGLDSTVALNLAVLALGKDKVIAANVVFDLFTYKKAKKNVLDITNSLQARLDIIPGKSEQIEIMKGGPDCNLCTKKVKLGLIREKYKKQIILTGSNQSDSWGKYGASFINNYFAPLFDYTKKDIRLLADYLNIGIRRIGENTNREGCKLKHLLKPMVNINYHGVAVDKTNEMLLRDINNANINPEKANVKIIGPLNRNIALVNIYPLPLSSFITQVLINIRQVKEVEECHIVDKPLELVIKANKGQFNNYHSRYWLEKGRLQPEFACPIKVRWLLTTNRKLKTFQVVDYNKLY